MMQFDWIRRKAKQSALLIICFAFSAPLAAQDTLPKKLLENYRFRSIGPAGMSGRITAIQVAPQNRQHIYVGSASGGLWKSENGGTSWRSLFSKERVSSVGALALDPHNPDLIYVGTGEGNPRNSLTSGYGLYRSLDGGRTWTSLGLENTRNIHRILVHPHNPKILYVAAIGTPWGDSDDRGVYKSEDGGKSWKKILYLGPATGAAELVMDPNNPEKLLVSMWEHRRNPWFFKSGGPKGGLYMTYDGGDNWEKIQKDSGLPEGDLGRLGLAIAPSNSKTVYALVEHKGNNGIYRSSDGGHHWKKISEDDNVGNRPFYYAEIYVDPKNENRIFSLWTLLSSSEDGGKSWEILTPYSDVHPDHHSFYIHPDDPDYILEGNDGGLNISMDGGKSWRFVENLPVAQFYHINYDMEIPYNVYGGMQDNGSWKGPAYVWRYGGIRNSYWEELYFGDGFDVVPDPDDSRYIYAMSQQGYVGRIDTKTGYSKLIRPVHPEGEDLRFNWNAAIAQDPFDNNSLYFGAQYVFKSTDKGDNWSLISPDLTTDDTTKQTYSESGGLTYDVTGAETYTSILAIEPDRLQKGVLWTGSDDGVLALTRDGGENWNKELYQKLPGAPSGGWIPQVVASPHKAGAAFVVVNDYRRNNWKAYLYYTDNYGKSWKNLVKEANLTGYVMSVVQDPIQPELLFMGMNSGLYFSLNSGKSWQKWGGDFPTVPVADLKIHPREGDLIVGTFGRSCWILDDLAPLRALAADRAAVEKGKLQLFSVPTAYQAQYKRADGLRFAADAMFAGDNRPYGARIQFWSGIDPKDSAAPKKVHLHFFNAEGDSIRTLKVDYAKGLNRANWYLDAKSMTFPSKSRDLFDSTEFGGMDILPGSYTLIARLGNNYDTVVFEVKRDPRMEVEVSANAEYLALRERIGGNLEVVQKASDDIKRAKASLKALRALTSYRTQDSTLEVLSDSIAAVERELNKLEEAIWGKEVEGYYDQPHTLQEHFYAVASYAGDNLSTPAQGGQFLADKFERATARYTEKHQAFFEGKWVRFTNYVEGLELGLFEPVQK